MWLIGCNSLRLFLRDKTAYIWLLAVPLVFTYFMGFAIRGPGDPSNPTARLLIENHDPGFASRVFLQILGTQGLSIIDPTNHTEAPRGLRIPATFTQEVLDRHPTKVEFFTNQGGAEDAAAMVEVRIARALIEINSLLIEHAAAHPGSPLTETSLMNLLPHTNEAVQLQSRFAGRKPMPVGFRMSLPGNLVAYLMMNLLIFGGATVAWERRAGVLRRFLVHPVRPGSLVGGKIYGLMLLGGVQTVVMLLAGRYLFQVKFGEQLPGILVTLLIYVWVAASLGVLVGSLVKAEEKVVGLCVLASLGMAALGGCWWPLEVVPDSVKMLAHLFPTGWAMDALHQWITFGGGWAQAKGAIGMLILFGLAANFAAAKCFRY
jgi:ABC-2 type transport system permease protein